MCLLFLAAGLTSPFVVPYFVGGGGIGVQSPDQRFYATLSGYRNLNPLSRDFLSIRGVAKVIDANENVLYKAILETGTVKHPMAYRELKTVSITWDPASTLVEFRSSTNLTVRIDI